MRSSSFSFSAVCFSVAIASVTACGGAQKKGAGGLASGGSIPPPPDVKKDPVADGKTVPTEAKREVSKDEKSDYNSALQSFLAAEKSGWNDSSCKQSAEKFDSVAREHAKLVEAVYMIGLSFQRCDMLEDAEKAYRRALGVKANHAQSLSNLGSIYWKAGKFDDAKKYWKSALDASGKLSGAYVGTATAALEDLRKTPAGPAWNKLADDISFNLSSALAVDSNDVRTYTVFGQFYLEGSEKNKNRLDLAKLLLDEGEKRDAKFAPLKNTRGLYFMKRNNLSEALKQFQMAVELDPKFMDARMNVGLTTLGFRKYDTSKEQFSKVLEQQPKNYDAVIGLGIALRGLGDFDGAETAYKKAKDLDGKRGEALFNLGVLYKDFKAAKQADLKLGQAAYRTARDYFKDFLTKTGTDSDKNEAKENITVCDKNIAMMENFIKNQASQPPAPAPAPAPGAPAAPKP
jgi:tetratricopeptide (TPR) repeat protein